MSLLDTLRKSLGLGENATEDDVAKKLAEGLKTEPTKNEPPAPAPTPNGNGHDGVTQKQLDEALEALRTSNDKASRAMADQVIKSLQEQNTKLTESLRLNKAHGQVRALSEGKGYVLPVPGQEDLLKILMEVPEETGDKIVKLFMELKDKGLVELGERGTVQGIQDVTLDELGDPIQQLGKLVERKMAEEKVDYGTALKEISVQKPQLYDAYRRAVDVKSGRR
jgi:hypothetical protein